MKKNQLHHSFSLLQIIAVGIAIFAMFFGAGNLVHPITVGMQSGVHVIVGFLGFLITAVCLPLLGLIALILFDGNYHAFFGRLGDTYSKNSAILISMLIIGPVIAIPRIVTLSHVMTAPFLPDFLSTITLSSSIVFAILFLGVTYLGAVKESGIITLLGTVIGPLKVVALAVIMIKGCLSASSFSPEWSGVTAWHAWTTGFFEGYKTLDLLGAVFFSSMTLHLLRRNSRDRQVTSKQLAFLGLQASLVGCLLLTLFYAGLTMLGYLHGHGLEAINSGELFRIVAFKVMGPSGAALIAFTVVMACLSTSIALCAVFAEYLQRMSRSGMRFEVALAITMILCFPLSIFGLDYVLCLAGGPIISIAYPVLIVLTLCNIAYKLWGFKPARTPVVITFVIAFLNYLRPL
jgi:branched-chain amino acid:cation transporter, LIVCS family